jgi:beta-ureidopropionase / N-carbamoyl-L-amino-acid hydrolase
MTVNAERLWRSIEELASITEPDQPYTRRSFSALHVEGRDWIRKQFEEAGLEPSLDAAANLSGLRPGTEAGLAPIMVGSHSDTVPGGGRFDGMAGVLSGLEVARALRDNGMQLRHPFEVVDFLAEEPSEFAMSCIGSRGMVGNLTADHLRLPAPDGEILGDAIGRMGGNATALVAPLRQSGSIGAYVEIHIEQGPVLESRDIAAGIVTAIVGIARTTITVTGRADHAGNTPMDMRRDALLGASRLVLLVDEEARAQASSNVYFVATVGQLDVEPNASNVVPGRVEFCVEYRSNSTPARGAFVAAMKRHGERIADEFELDIHFELVSDADPAICADVVRDCIRDGCKASAHDFLDMPSGAGHDAMQVAQIAPMGMIFIPCREGRSHCPDEWVSPEDLTAGAEVLYETVLALDARLD